MEVFLVEHRGEEDISLVGIYSTFDMAHRGMLQHSEWFNKSKLDYYCVPQVVDVNNTKDCIRYDAFNMVEKNPKAILFSRGKACMGYYNP